MNIGVMMEPDCAISMVPKEKMSIIIFLPNMVLALFRLWKKKQLIYL